jgi:hypothetical protein
MESVRAAGFIGPERLEEAHQIHAQKLPSRVSESNRSHTY